MHQQRVHHSVQQLRQVLDVVPNRYYAWRHTQVAGGGGGGERTWETEMFSVSDCHNRRHGIRHLSVVLRGKGYLMGCQALRAGLRHNRRALQPKSFARVPPIRRTGRGGRPEFIAGPATPDSVQFGLGERHHVFVPANGHWVYLYAFQDVFTKLVVCS